VEDFCIPAEKEFEEALGEGTTRRFSFPAPARAILERLKTEARSRGLWNLWLPKEFPQGAGLTNTEYAMLAEVTGRSTLAPEACNCSAPDTGNMEVLLRYGTDAQKAKWLAPLVQGTTRSAFLMTEPAVASSDAGNIECTFERAPGGGYIIHGTKWWSSGALDPRCSVAIVMGKVVESKAAGGRAAGGGGGAQKEGGSGEGGDGGGRKKHDQQTMLLMPMDAPGVRVKRALTVFGYDDAPHGHAEVELDRVQVGPEALLLGEGRGFEIAQGRLGPGRVHHCMRMVGLTERCLELAGDRAVEPRKGAFGQPVLGKLGVVRQRLAQGRASIEQSRLLVLECAQSLDADANQGNGEAEGGGGGGATTGPSSAVQRSGVKSLRTLQLVALIKATVPLSCERVIDGCLQLYGGEGVCQDQPLARAFAGARSLRLADGPDEVHEVVVARFELKAAELRRQKRATKAGLGYRQGAPHSRL